MKVLLAALAVSLACPIALAEDPPDPATDPVLRVYDVRDILRTEADIEDLERAIIEAGASEMRVEYSKGRGVIIVKASPVEHSMIERLLNALRESMTGKRLVNIETRILKSREALLPGGGAGGARVLEAGPAERLLAALGSREDVTVLNAPRLVCYERQRANISMLDQMSYIADFEVKTADGGATVADPIVATARAGVVLEVKPIVSADGKLVTLLLDATRTTIRKPVPVVRITLAGGTTAEIQTPAITTTSWKRAVTIPPGGRALLDLGGTPDGDGERLALLVSVPRIFTRNSLEPGVEAGDEIDLVPAEPKKK